MPWAIGDWLWHSDSQTPCQIVDVQPLWGQTSYRVWLPNPDTVVRVPAHRLEPLAAHHACALPHHLTYVAAAARIADALTQDLLLAPMTASVVPLPHQIRALSRAISGDRVRYLLADEVGLGKTIEAGLIMRELKLRGLVTRTLVIAPKGLVTQWVAEMRTHFSEDFRLLVPSDFSAYRHIAQHDNLWRSHPQVICSMDAVKPIDSRRGWSPAQVAAYNRERFEDLIAAGWDLVIVDEAHRLGGSTDQVARYKLGQGLAEAAPYLLLLSATPHQGKTDAFHRLLSLIDTEAFPDVGSVTQERVRPYVIRTEKRRAIDADGHPLFRPRRTQLTSETSAESVATRLQEYVREARDTVAVLGIPEDLDPGEVQRLLSHPLPHWVERMTVSYVQAHGGKVEQNARAWDLTWPGGETLHNVVFIAREAAQQPAVRHLTLEEPAVRGLAMRLPRVVPGQPIPCIVLPDLPADVCGVWSLWRIALSTPDWHQQRMTALFLHEDGRTLLPTARFIWEQLLSGPPEILGHLYGEPAHAAFGKLREAAEVHGKSHYDMLVQAHRARLTRLCETDAYAFAARQRTIEKVGLQTVRSHRLAQLAQEERAWREHLARQAEVQPELTPLLIAYVTQGYQLPAFLLGTMSPRTP